MRIEKVRVEGYRLLEDIEIVLEKIRLLNPIIFRGDYHVIGKLLSELFKTVATPTATEADQELAAKLKEHA